MKLTEKQLKKIILEELTALSESWKDYDPEGEDENLSALSERMDRHSLDEELLAELESDPAETVTCTEFLQRETLDEKKAPRGKEKPVKTKKVA